MVRDISNRKSLSIDCANRNSPFLFGSFSQLRNSIVDLAFVHWLTLKMQKWPKMNWLSIPSSLLVLIPIPFRISRWCCRKMSQKPEWPFDCEKPWWWARYFRPPHFWRWLDPTSVYPRFSKYAASDCPTCASCYLTLGPFLECRFWQVPTQENTSLTIATTN